MLDHVEKVIPGQSHNCMEKGMLDGVECDICHTVLVEPAIGYGKHEYKNGECIHCGETENTSKGLWMSYNSYYDGYQVVGIGECTDEHIVIPKLYKGFPVVAIKDMAFRDNRNIKSVVLPDSIVAIGDYAFFQCNNLRSVKMGDSVTSIGSNAFVNCFSLEEIELSDSLTYIGSCAFEGCRSLKAIVIGGDDDSIDLLIGGSAFVDCPSLQSVVLGRSVSTLYGRAFNGCVSLYAVTFDGTVEEWQKVDCLIGWLDGSSITKVICTDGEVSVN